MNKTRTTTIVVLVALATGLGGCNLGKSEFEWPWRKKTAPVTEAQWSSEKDWPKPKPDPNAGTDVVDPHAPVLDPASPAAGTTRGDGEEPLLIGETREIATSVISIKGKFITVQEILNSARDELAAVPQDGMFDRRIRAVVIRSIGRRINNELIYSEAESRLSQPQKDHVNAEVEDMVRGLIADAGGSKTRLEDQLAQRGITLKELREEQRRALTVQIYQQIKFVPAISVTRQMLLGYYSKHKDEFTVEKKVAMQLIAVLLNDERYLPKDVGSNPSPQELARARLAARERIEKADKLLKSGSDFGDVAREFSNIKPDTGGKLPLWAAGSLRQKEVEKAGFSLQQGQRSGIIESAMVRNSSGGIVNYGGFYIVKAYQVQEGKTTSFEDAQDDINKILRNKQLQVLSAKFSERLARESKIPQSPDFVETAVNQAIRLYWKEGERQ
jgi:hypothetical protein